MDPVTMAMIGGMGASTVSGAAAGLGGGAAGGGALAGLGAGGMSLSNAMMLGGGLSMLGDLFGGGTSFGLGQMSVGKQWDKWKDSQTRGPKYRMIGLREANLNPILAARGGLGGAGGGGFAPSAVASGGGGLPLGSNATRAAKELGLMRDQANLLKAQRGQQDSTRSLNRSVEAIRRIEKGTAMSARRAAAANANAVEQESLARQAQALIDQDRSKWYAEHPNVYVAKDLVQGASQLINSATNFVGSFGDMFGTTDDEVFDDKTTTTTDKRGRTQTKHESGMRRHRRGKGPFRIPGKR